MKNVQIVRHPLIAHSLTLLRDKKTKTEDFRKHASIVSKILLLEAIKELRTKSVKVHTPLAPISGKELDERLVVVPVLRAGLAMLFALQDLLPAIQVGFIGLERDEKTAIARQYYQKLPQIFSHSKVLVIDPMLATGGSFCDTARILHDKKATDITFINIVAAPEGIHRVEREFPKVKIFTGAVDAKLNSSKYIVPGLGDFGDRYFGT